MENPIEMDDLGGTPIFGNIHIGIKYIKVLLHSLKLSYKPISENPFFWGMENS